MKEKVLKHVAKLKKVSSQKTYLSKCIAEMVFDLETMRNLRHFPNPMYKDKPVSYDRTDELYLDIEYLKVVAERLSVPCSYRASSII